MSPEIFLTPPLLGRDPAHLLDTADEEVDQADLSVVLDVEEDVDDRCRGPSSRTAPCTAVVVAGPW